MKNYVDCHFFKIIDIVTPKTCPTLSSKIYMLFFVIPSQQGPVKGFCAHDDEQSYYLTTGVVMKLNTYYIVAQGLPCCHELEFVIQSHHVFSFLIWLSS